MERIEAFNVRLFGAIIAFGSILYRKGRKLIQESIGKLVTYGFYFSIRYPKNSILFLISIGMLIRRSILLALMMWSFLIYAYYRFALREERDVLKVLSLQHEEYRQKISAFIPISKTKIIYYNEE